MYTLGHQSDVLPETALGGLFYLALFDDTGDADHFKAGGSSPTTFSPNIPSIIDTTPVAPDNLLLYAGITALGIIVVVAIVLFMKRS